MTVLARPGYPSGHDEAALRGKLHLATPGAAAMIVRLCVRIKLKNKLIR